MSVRQTGRQISVEQSFSFGVQHRHRICPVSKLHDGLRRRSIARPFRQTHAVRISGLGEIRPVLLDLVGKRSVAVGPRPVDRRLRLEHIGKFRGMERADLDRVRSWGEPGEAVNIRGLCPRRRLVAMSSRAGTFSIRAATVAGPGNSICLRRHVYFGRAEAVLLERERIKGHRIANVACSINCRRRESRYR
jgi:hypothetical protein